MADESGPSASAGSVDTLETISGRRAEGSTNGASTAALENGPVLDHSDKYAQAVRFLVSLQSQKNQDQDAQRAFLLAKGLDEPSIERAMEEARRPQSVSALAEQTTERARTSTEGLSDPDAFDKAARMFDDPLHSEIEGSGAAATSPALPPRTYPRSPLALYQQSTPQGQQRVQSTIDNPLTRYHVLLRFFRSLSYFLMLGGGIAAVFVGVYRSYMMPRIVATLDARSQLLKHHRDLYIMLANRINDVRHNSLVTMAPSNEHANAKDASVSRRSSLKKVQFADEVGVAASSKHNVPKDAHSDEEEKKESGDHQGEGQSLASEISEKTSLLAKDASLEGAQTGGDDMEAPQVEQLEPIDIMGPLRESLAHLRDTLRADTSASAIGTGFDRPSKSAMASTSTTAATVQDESDADSWLSESDSDELEFDPFAAPTNRSRNGTAASRRKHTPKSGATASAKPHASAPTPSASESSSSALKTSLGSIHAYMNSQTFRARASGGVSSFGSGAPFGTLGGIGTPIAGVDGKDEAAKTGASANRQGDVAQIRADIRSLKGLLLSRRNFPIYGRPMAGAAGQVETAS